MLRMEPLKLGCTDKIKSGFTSSSNLKNVVLISPAIRSLTSVGFTDDRLQTIFHKPSALRVIGPYDFPVANRSGPPREKPSTTCILTSCSPTEFSNKDSVMLLCP